MTVYQHVIPGMQADAAATFSEVLFGNGITPRPVQARAR
jgi:hypothetical protein